MRSPAGQRTPQWSRRLLTLAPCRGSRSRSSSGSRRSSPIGLRVRMTWRF